MNMAQSNANIASDKGTGAPSHLTPPCSRNVAKPITAPKTTIGCRRINRRRKNSLLVNPCRQRSSRSEEHTSELQSRQYLVCRLLLEKKNNIHHRTPYPTSPH